MKEWDELSSEEVETEMATPEYRKYVRGRRLTDLIPQVIGPALLITTFFLFKHHNAVYGTGADTSLLGLAILASAMIGSVLTVAALFTLGRGYDEGTFSYYWSEKTQRENCLPLSGLPKGAEGAYAEMRRRRWH